MNLIDQLTEDLKPVQPIPKAGLVTTAWLFGSGLLLGGGIALFHRYRNDIDVLIHSFQFLWIFASLLLLSALSALMALRTAVPGKDLSKAWFAVLVIFFVSALAPLALRGMNEPAVMAMSGLDPRTGWHCSFSLAMYALTPLAALIWFIHRKLASTKPVLTGSLVGLSVGAFGAATLAWTCPSNEGVHLMVWHLVPVFIFSFIFAKMSRKFLCF
jgi:hypothetical protein